MPREWPGQEGFTRYLGERVAGAIEDGYQPPIKVVMASSNGFVLAGAYDGEGGICPSVRREPR
jgi:hypothetical protein